MVNPRKKSAKWIDPYNTGGILEYLKPYILMVPVVINLAIWLNSCPGH